MRCKNPNCKDKFEAKVFLQKFCLEKDECIELALADKIAQIEKAKKKEWDKEKDAIKKKNGWETKKPPKNVLQDEINKLARVIDAHFKLPCISCGNTNDVKYDGGHRISVGACISIRYNLHNVRRQCSKNCNTSLAGNPDGYDEGLKKRYGLKYKNYVKYELRKIYPYMNLGSLDYPEKIKLVRKLIRDFDTFVLIDSIQARNMFNALINIYK
jgi:hypothetical protein